MYTPDDKTKTGPRAGGKKMQREKALGFHMRASRRWLDQLDAASKALGIGKTALVEAALAAYCPEYFAAEGPEVSSGLHCAKYAPQLFERPEGEKKRRQPGGPAVPEAKRKGCDSKGSREKFSEQ